AAAVKAKWVAGGTRTELKLNRDVGFSYQDLQPYYLLTDIGLGITQRLTYSWDVTARGARQFLDYKGVTDPALALTPPAEPNYEYGGGVGYLFGKTLRLGIDVIYYQRRSTTTTLRNYDGMRYGASVVYGLPQ